MGYETVLISLIGKGRNIKKDINEESKSKGYIKTKYYFEEVQDVIYTSFFGSALYQFLDRQGFFIDKWLIFGTDKSNWSELLFLVDEQYHDNLLELYDKVYDEENEQISKELLAKWEKVLQQFIPGIRLIMVDPLDYEVFINYMIKEIPNDKRNIVLDITHAFRHMPVIIAFSLMTLKHIKDISNVIVYYGAYELKENRNDINEPTPVLKIDFINTLVSYAENLAIFNNSGYFPGILENLGISGTENTYFWLEMNRQPRKDLELINKKLEEKATYENYQGEIAEHIGKELQPLIDTTLDKRMIERARFFFTKKQYLKALILLYEGIIIAIGKKYGFYSGLDYKEKEKIREYIKDNKESIFKNKQQENLYFELEYTRNAAVHGSISRGVQNYVEQQDQFEFLFTYNLETYKYLKGGKSC